MAALAGYEFHFGRAITKVFAGVEAVDSADQSPRSKQLRAGKRGRLARRRRDWIDLSPTWHLSADAAYGTAFQEYWSLARIGYRLKPRLSVGVEGGALGNQEYDAGRAGAFARFYLLDTEMTLASGFTGNYLEDEPSGYLSLGVRRAF